MLDRRTLLTGAAAGMVTAATGCAGRVPGFGDTVTIAVAWSGAELAAFRSVLHGLNLRDYGFELIPMGDDISTALSSGAGRRPDIVMLPQPGLVRLNRDRLMPLPERIKASWNYADVWDKLLFWSDENGEKQTYGLPFKMAHKSVVWYRKSVFAAHNLPLPQCWSEWLSHNQTLAAAGIAPLALAGADGWMLTDFFENVLVGCSPDVHRRLIGPRRSRLANESGVRHALRLLGNMWAPVGTLSGGATGSLVRQFGDAVVDVVGHGRAAMVVAPDFAEPVVQDFALKRDDIGVFFFPKIDGDEDCPGASPQGPLLVGGDVAVLSSTASKHAQDLVLRLANPAAPEPWINTIGGFLRTSQYARSDDYSTELRTLANDLSCRSSSIRFDLSDQLGSIGGGDGLWRVLQDFLAAVGGKGDAVDLSAAVEAAIGQLRALEE